MKIEIKIDQQVQEPILQIITNEMTDELQQLVKTLSTPSIQLIAGTKGQRVHLLEPKQVVRIYASQKKIIAQTLQDQFLLKGPLYEWEQQLKNHRFIRLSHSELVNLNHVKGFDLNISGTICVRLSNQKITYVSRRYISKLKEIIRM